MTILLNVDARSSAQQQDAVTQALDRAGLKARVMAVRGDEVATAAADAAATGGILVGAGGDGTVSTVAAAAVRAGVTFGVLPLGTLNHFAQDAGVPLDLDAAVDALAKGHTTQVDVGEVNDRIFINNVSLGAYPVLVWERDIEQRRGRSKWTGFAIGAWRAWTRYRLLLVRLTLDGDARACRTPFVFVGNGDYQIEGLKTGSRPLLTDGALSVFVAPECGRFEALALPLRALAGQLIEPRRVERVLSARVQIDTHRHHVTLAVDGELVKMNNPLRCVVRPGALRLIVPATA